MEPELIEKNDVESDKRYAWWRHRQLKKDYALTLRDLIRQVQDYYDANISIDGRYEKTLTTCALFIVLYLTGGRIAEVVCPPSKRSVERTLADGTKKTYNYEYDGIGLRVGDIRLEPAEPKEGEKQYMVIRLRVLKRRTEVIMRNAYVRYNAEDDVYKDLVKILSEYLEIIVTDKAEDKEPLFEMSVQSARQYITRAFNINPHFLRDCRCTHLMSINKLNTAELQKYFAWKSPGMVLRYSLANDAEILNKI